MSTRSLSVTLTLALTLAACSSKPDDSSAEAKPDKTEASKPDAAKQGESARKPSPNLEDPFKDGGDAAPDEAPRIVLGCVGSDGVSVDGEPVEGSGAELDAAVIKQITARLAAEPKLVGVVSCDGDDAATRALHLLELLRDNGVTKIGDATERKVSPDLQDPFKKDGAAGGKVSPDLQDPFEKDGGEPAEAGKKTSPDLSDPFEK